MVAPPTPDQLYDSARDFATTALEAHQGEKYRQAALHAGTSLEHLAKACLASRSPALLADLKREENFPSLLLLLGIPEGKPPRHLRTVGLREALARIARLVPSGARKEDLLALVDIRDGTVHAAHEEEMEVRLLVAFARHADALVADLGRDRAEFWGLQLNVVDALLAEMTGEIEHRVMVKMAAAKANYQRLYGAVPAEVIDVIRRVADRGRGMGDEEPTDCPACGSRGMTYGDADIQWTAELGRKAKPVGTIWWEAWSFDCPVCRLSLESQDELTAASIPTRWEVKEADPLGYVGIEYYEQALSDVRARLKVQ